MYHYYSKRTLCSLNLPFIYNSIILFKHCWGNNDVLFEIMIIHSCLVHWFVREFVWEQILNT